ncbi:MAG: hypothetical protein R6V59_07730 [Dehalococcoidia bacterium]
MDISQVAAGGYHTVGLKNDDTVVAAGPDIELAEWNLGVVEYDLAISSTAGGSVTTPGEGPFTRNAGWVARLVAEPDKGYRFVNWSGDVDTIANVKAATTIITMQRDCTIAVNFEEIPAGWPLIVGIVVGVVAAGLAVFFLHRRRAARTKRRKKSARKERR